MVHITRVGRQDVDHRVLYRELVFQRTPGRSGVAGKGIAGHHQGTAFGQHVEHGPTVGVLVIQVCLDILAQGLLQTDKVRIVIDLLFLKRFFVGLHKEKEILPVFARNLHDGHRLAVDDVF